MPDKLKRVGGIFLKAALFATPLASLFLAFVHIAAKDTSYHVWCGPSRAQLYTMAAYASLAASVILPLLMLRVASAMHRKTGEATYRLARRVLHIFFYASLVVAVLAFFSSLSATRLKSRDARRISDIRQAQLVIELYFDRHNAYPISRGASAVERWEAVGRLAIAEGFVPGWPSDPCAKEYPQRQYDYKVSDDGNAYVLRAILDYARNTALAKDADGDVLGVWCGEAGKDIEYCVAYPP